MTNPKAKSVDDIRHTEYYGLQETFDGLYAKSKDGEIFTNLMDVVLRSKPPPDKLFLE